ncbi:cyclase family protein [Streptomyces sp. NBC_00582]|uniref:cyclase family protein n=1 Tax=Streptomyces sp. NBC_00582 TaxID=2975783 RepID=UPI001063A782|nr:cyclase family protein [Streptomyces sp. NBC_00582]WUB59652.1 cyclase family protein [Streptomyces sp. NBC_00582]
MRTQSTGRTPTTARVLDELFAGARLVDLSRTLEEGMPTYPTHAKYFQNRWLSMGDVARMNQLVLGEHTGTHVDSPCHFPVEGPHAGVGVEELPLTALTGRCATVTPDPPPAPDEMVGPGPLLDWEAHHGPLLAGDVVLMNFQWGATRWGLHEAGFAHLREWPGIARETAELLRERDVRAVGTDCVSLDSGDGGRGELPAHFVLLTAGVLIIENLAHLDLLPPLCFFLAFPLRIAHGTGSPLRAVAVLDGARA